MENASKALLIAGAILLAILLISFGIIVIRQGSGIINSNGMSEAEVTTFNEKFSKYEGDIKGNMVKALIQEVNASNSNENNSENQVTLIGPSNVDGSNNTYKTSEVKNATTYNVEVTKNDKNGRISEITITGGDFKK